MHKKNSSDDPLTPYGNRPMVTPIVHSVNYEYLDFDVQRQITDGEIDHGHYDHTGGFAAIARSQTRREKSVVAYAHPRALEGKYARNADGTGRYIGMAADFRNALHTSFELLKTEAPAEVGEGLMVTGPIPRVTDFEDTGGPFFKDAECRQTGFQAAARLWKEFPDRVRACPVGTRVDLPA